MRQFITVISQKVSLRSTSLVVSVLLSVVAIPAAVLAWGPNRATFTQANPATYVTFNSITDAPKYGDERNFFRVREVSSNAAYDDDANLVPGKEYEALIFFHNNASSSFNAGGTGIAHGAYARAEMPAVVKAGATNTEAEAFVGATNANPTTVYDYISFQNATDTDISLRMIPGSVKIHSNGAVDGQVLSDTALFGSNGTPLGFDSLNGVLPGCDHYSGYIDFHFVAVQPNFDFQKDVRVSGTKQWEDSVAANPGATVDYKLTYKNTGQVNQSHVTMKDILPQGVTFLPGKTKLYNGEHPNGKTISDEISAGGMDIGNYAPGAVAYLVFSARIDGTPCTALTNTADVETNNGNLRDTATVNVGGSCALPTTGPVEVISGLIGVAAITLGIVYYFRSRRDLDNTLLHAQSHPRSHSTKAGSDGTNPTLTDIAESIHPSSHKHKK